MVYTLTSIIGIIIGLGIAYFIYLSKKNTSLREINNAKEIAQNITDSAQKEAEALKKKAILDGKEEWFKTQRTYENEIKERQNEIKERQNELRNLEKKFNERVTNFEKRLDVLDKKEQSLVEYEKSVKKLETEYNEKNSEIAKLVEEQKRKLMEISGLSREQALNILKQELSNEARNVCAHEIRQELEQLKLDANKKAAEIIATAVQRLAVDHISESTVSVVSLPSDEMKGRIIGREGRNIRAFEKASGVDLIIDDTPEAVVLSCFDPVRREIAKLSLERLISDGRIHPGRIEELVEKTRKEMETTLVSIGEKACLETNIHNISPNLIKLIGRLNYRTSYGQNVLNHSIEAAWICGIMAVELGLDQDIARRCGFLHDLGKAIDHEFEGSHASLGANFARKNGESKLIVNAIEAHHEEVEAESVYAVLVQAADAISGARPGARREMLETYMQRLEKLEEIANSIEGVNKSYAIQAGRELRIIVDPTNIDDENTVFIATDIAKQIEQQVQYPGQIKVTVIRETRQVAVAK
ncbi:MAG: ribonuclease Y [Candidatus Cloacimonetes bacterium]|nr:ribonuclease Y [Candidatus Cloacimonadota bacterium]